MMFKERSCKNVRYVAVFNTKKPVSTGVLRWSLVKVSVFVWPPSRLSASNRCTSWPVLRRA